MPTQDTLTPRQQAILQAVVEQYVEAATPVGSEGLLTYANLQVSPATVRNEMMALEEAGYLTHPHTSSGRIPTEKGYRFYVRQCVLGEKKSRRHVAALEQTVRQADDETDALKLLAKKVAELTQGAALIGFAPRQVYYTGLGYLFSQPEFHEAALMIRMGELLDHLDEVMAEVYDTVPTEVVVLIGQDNPFGQDCGSVLVRLNVTGAAPHIFGIIGPMRMDYQANTALLLSVREVVEGLEL